MLLCGIIDELQNEKPACDPVYFFCQATDSNLNTASAVMRGVLYLILKKHVHLVKYLRDTHDHSSRQLFENENSWDALCSMVTSVFNDQCLHNTVLIIDALDECIGDGEKLLEFINKLSLKGVRIIASSRNSIPIERGVAAGTQNATHISLERNERSISASVAAFIRHKVTLLTRKHEYNTSIRKLVYDTLVEKANDTFLWAALVCQQLEVNSVNNWEVASKLQSFPPGLDILYARMLDQVTILATDADIFRKILTVASLVFRPVNISELKHLIGSSGTTIGSNRSLERAVQQCGSFLTVRDDVVYFLHQSAREFLLKAPIVGNIMPNGVIYEQNLLWSNSLKAISTTLRRNIYDLKLPETPVEEVKSPKPDPLYSIKYCCVHWADHFCAMACKTYEKEQATELVSFLTRKYLQWLEAMSLLREVPRGIHCITNALRAVQGCPGHFTLTGLLQDALKFLQHHWEGIEYAPLQIYCSALIFSPQSSIIRKLYQHQQPKWLLTKPHIMDEWSRRIHTIKLDNAFDNMAVSHNGQIIASFMYKHDDCKTSLWDVSTGQCLRSISLRGNSLMEFSPDGVVIAYTSGTFECMIRNIETGELLRTFESHEAITSISFSPAGKKIAITSQGSAKLWNLDNGHCAKALPVDVSLGVYYTAFSPDGCKLVTGAGNYFDIWDLQTERILKRIEIDESRENIVGVTFLGDGDRIASKLFLGTVDVWDANTGEQLRNFKPILAPIALSPSRGGRAAFYTTEGTVSLCSLETGREVGTMDCFVRHGAIMLSNDASRLITSADRDAVTVWDLTDIEQSYSADTFRDPGLQNVSDCVLLKRTQIDNSTLQISSISLSYDGKRAASTSRGHSHVQIWDTESGRKLQKLYLRNALVSTNRLSGTGDSVVAYSRDERVLVAIVCNEPLSVQIWDATADSLLRSLDVCPQGGIKSMAFSSDASILATEGIKSYTRIRLWNTDTGKCLGDSKFSHTIRWMELPGSGSRLYTNAGALELPSPEALSGSGEIARLKKMTNGTFPRPSFGIEPDFPWIMNDGHKMIWLPEGYRPRKFAVRKPWVALACSRGLIFLRVRDDDTAL